MFEPEAYSSNPTAAIGACACGCGCTGGAGGGNGSGSGSEVRN